MALALDWAQRAADEIARGWTYGSGRDDYVTDEQRAAVARYLRRVIVKHCPLEPDTAYMPVPRCETCKHWAVTDVARTYAPSFGECTLNTTANDDEWRARRLAVAYAGRFFVRPDFGCVQWEGKRESHEHQPR